MQIQATGYHHTPIRIARARAHTHTHTNLTMSMTGKAMEPPELSLVVRKKKATSAGEDSLAVSYKVKQSYHVIHPSRSQMI